MTTQHKKIAVTDVVLRDAHQSLLASRLRLEDMLPIAKELDDIGYWSLEVWGGDTFETCIRFLGEDPWQRLRELKKAMPRTPLQMLLHGQQLLGDRHYANDVVDRFVERALANGMSVFRVFDAMNSPHNMKQALQAVRKQGGHAQGTLNYTSPNHTLQKWLDLSEQLLEIGIDSLVIKDMSGILTPTAAYELVSEIKKRYDIRLHLHCHATTGMAEMALLKAIEAGVDGIDTAISSMSGTYGHPATEALVATLQGTGYDTGLDISKLERIAAYFRDVRKKYAQFEGQLKGVDSRILTEQVPDIIRPHIEEMHTLASKHSITQLKEKEMDTLLAEVKQQAVEKGVKLAKEVIDDALTVALFPQIAWEFLENRDNPTAFEPTPTTTTDVHQPKQPAQSNGTTVYTMELAGKAFVTKVSEGGDISPMTQLRNLP